LAGDAEEGVRLTRLGLRRETSRHDRVVGLSNLCAGYLMLERFDEALDACNRAIADGERHWRAYSNRALLFVLQDRLDEAERDLRKAEELAPASRTVRTVRSMLRDRTDPVAPTVIIEDRRVPAKPEAGDDG
jgi:tetratricopeptide (TPR) repeat protein